MDIQNQHRQGKFCIMCWGAEQRKEYGRRLRVKLCRDPPVIRIEVRVRGKERGISRRIKVKAVRKRGMRAIGRQA